MSGNRDRCSRGWDAVPSARNRALAACRLIFWSPNRSAKRPSANVSTVMPSTSVQKAQVSSIDVTVSTRWPRDRIVTGPPVTGSHARRGCCLGVPVQTARPHPHPCDRRRGGQPAYLRRCRIPGPSRCTWSHAGPRRSNADGSRAALSLARAHTALWRRSVETSRGGRPGGRQGSCPPPTFTTPKMHFWGRVPSGEV